MADTVECPYCEFENDMNDILGDLPDNNKTDWECGNCERKFEIYIEFEPSYSASEIVYEECDCCKKSIRDACHKNKMFPFPKGKYETVCRDCWSLLMKKEWEKESGKDE